MWIVLCLALLAALVAFVVRDERARCATDLSRRVARAKWPCPKCGGTFGEDAASRSTDIDSIHGPTGWIGIDCPNCGPVILIEGTDGYMQACTQCRSAVTEKDGGVCPRCGKPVTL